MEGLGIYRLDWIESVLGLMEVVRCILLFWVRVRVSVFVCYA